MSQGIERFFLLTYCLACCWPGLGARSNLRIIKQWSEPEFVFPSDEAKQKAIQKGFYKPQSAVLVDVDVDHRQAPFESRIFVTIPRFSGGRPITLGTVDEQGKIHAYPDYSWHDDQGTNCGGLTSVWRVAIDECKRFWVLDAGKIEDAQVCPPQILAFDLSTDQLIYRHILNESSYTSESLLITPVVDVRSRGARDCAHTFIYAADVAGFAVVVLDVMRDKSWRVTHRLFYPYPNWGNFFTDGVRFDVMDGVFGLALSPYRMGHDRYLYFHALSATTENMINTSVIRNDSLTRDPSLVSDAIYLFPEERPSQSVAEAMDRNGILYFGQMDPPSIWCWNSATEFTRQNFHPIALDQETLKFASGVKIVTNAKGEEELWVVTCSLLTIMTGRKRLDRPNNWIHSERLSVILANSPCRNPPNRRKQGYHSHPVKQSG